MAEPHWAKSSGLTDSERELVEAKRQAEEKGKIISLVKEDSKDLPRGNMGLKGMLAILGNSTSMLILAAVAVFWTVYQAPSMHREGVKILRELYDSERTEQRRVLEQLGKSMEANTAAVKELAAEVRWLGKGNGK